jgi:apolipoprotein D and lipocalin family protein
MVLLLVLTACGFSGLRDPSVPMGGTSRFDRIAFAGPWLPLACIGPCPEIERFEVGGEGRYRRFTGTTITHYDIVSPGVLREVDRDETIVIMWVDTDFRTAAVGAASGQWAAILNRGDISEDRVTAALQILEFNGWDVSKLRRVVP